MKKKDSENKELVSNEILSFLSLKRIPFQSAWLFDRPELGIGNGHVVKVGRSEITFKLLDVESLLIVLYKIDKQDRQTLGFSLRDLIRFLHLLGDNIPSLKKAVGLVDVFPYRACEGIRADRLSKLYVRFGAEVSDVDGRKWVEYKLK